MYKTDSKSYCNKISVQSVKDSGIKEILYTAKTNKNMVLTGFAFLPHITLLRESILDGIRLLFHITLARNTDVVTC